MRLGGTLALGTADMKAEQCTVGAEVYTDDGPNYRYVVTELPDEAGMVRVKPTEDSYASGRIESYHLDDLHLYDPELLKQIGAEMQAKVDEAKTAFEAAFQALAKVRDFRTQDGVYISRYEMQDLGLVSLKELERTIESGGWSSSSLWC